MCDAPNNEKDSVGKNFKLSLLLGTLFLSAVLVGFITQVPRQGVSGPMLVFLVVFAAALLAYRERKNWARYVLLGFSTLIIFSVPYTWIFTPEMLVIGGEDRSGLLIGYGVLCLAFMASLVVSRRAMESRERNGASQTGEERSATSRSDEVIEWRDGQKVVRCASCGNTVPEFIVRCPACGNRIDG